MGSRRVLGRMPTRSRRSSTRAGSPRSRVSAPTRRAAGSGGSTRASSGDCRCRPRTRRRGGRWRTRDDAIWPTTTRSRTCISSTPRTAVHWTHQPRILSEHLAPLPEPLACLLTPTAIGPAPAVAALGARALLDLAPLALEGEAPWPAWLAQHQVPAAARLVGILARHGRALPADAVGLGKSYVALAVALALGEPFALVVPAVLVDQWRTLLEEHGVKAPIVTHESLSATPYRPLPPSTVPYRLFIVDEAHRFRNPITNRYRALARLVVGSRVLPVTATPVHNRIADLFHLFRLFLRDHDLTALGVPSLWRASRGDARRHAVTAAAARLSVSRSREHVQAGYGTGPVVLPFPERAAGESIRVGTAPDAELRQLVTGVAGLEAGGEAAALFRLLLLSQLASSLPAVL